MFPAFVCFILFFHLLTFVVGPHPPRKAAPSPSGSSITSASSSVARASVAVVAEATEEIGELPGDNGPSVATAFVRRKTVEVVSAEDGAVYTQRVATDEQVELHGTVKYDAQERQYYDSMKVPTALVGMLRGKDCVKTNKLEKTFRCRIHFPKKRSAAMETEIRFTTTESAHHILGCREEIMKALVDARKQAYPTHFLSVPVFDETLREQYAALVQRIQEDAEMPKDCQNAKVFMPLNKLHLTLTVFKLFTEAEIQEVRQLLEQQLRSDKIRKILDGTKGKVQVRFPAMRHFENKSPDRVGVLFANAESERMQQLANALDDALSEAGLAEKRRSKDVILHMTMINTKYLYNGRPKLFDATPVLERYGQLQLNPVDLEEIHLCEMMGSATPGDRNGYKSVFSIKFPTD